jgi:O-methyltransferase
MSCEAVTPSAQDRYVELMKQAVSFSLWPEPPVPITVYRPLSSRFQRSLISVASRGAAAVGLELVKRRDVTPAAREEGRYWPAYADTMIGLRRLDNLQYCVQTTLQDAVPGDFIETGVWKGGACIFMRAILAAHQVTDRKVFVADSFQGLPEPDEETHPADRGDRHHTQSSWLAISQESVEANCRKYGLLDDQVVFLKGWFKDTLPTAPIETLAVLRIDGDMYASTMDPLESLYPKLSNGGFLIIDDYYALPACQSAVTDYRARHGINTEIVKVDWAGAYWRKDGQA